MNVLRTFVLVLPFVSLVCAQNSPIITLVANAEGENPVIAPNTWVEIKGQNLSKAGDSRVWGSPISSIASYRRSSTASASR